MCKSCCEVKVSGTVVEVVSHELGADAAMAVGVFQHDPFVAPHHTAPVAALTGILGDGALRFGASACEPGIRYLDGAE